MPKPDLDPQATCRADFESQPHWGLYCGYPAVDLVWVPRIREWVPVCHHHLKRLTEEVRRAQPDAFFN